MKIRFGRQLVEICSIGVLALASVAGSVFAEDVVVGEKPEGWVERAIFTSAIDNREPVDELVAVGGDLQEIYFFSELRQLAGRTVTHRWEYEGEVVSEVPFEVGGPRWRVFSKKTLLPTQAGKWAVVVVDESGWALHAVMFDYRPAVVTPVGVDVVEGMGNEPIDTDADAPLEVPVIEPVLELPVESAMDAEIPPAGDDLPLNADQLPPPAPEQLRME